MILLPQIFDVTANENARYKRNELECVHYIHISVSKTSHMSRGIRQGCPISAILYLFVAEILAIKVRVNDQIEGFVCNNLRKEIKSVQHADDLTLALKNINAIGMLLKQLTFFANMLVPK